MVGQAIEIDVYLRRLQREVTQLPDLASMLAEEPPDVRDVWHWQWDELIRQLNALCEQHRLKLMSMAQEREFAELIRQLDGAQPALELLGLCLPEDAGTEFVMVEMTSGESIGV
jgi:hypothetical protein